jgi:Zn-dependent metalloprotease
MKYVYLLTVVLFFSQSVFSQISFPKVKGKLDLQNQQQKTDRHITINSKTQAGIYFRDKQLQDNKSADWIKTQLELRQGIDSLKEDTSYAIYDGITIKKLHQYYKGIKVEHGVINTTSSHGNVAMIQMEVYSIPDGFNTKPTLTEDGALKKALDFVGATSYVWDSYTGTDPEYMKPKGELVIIQTYKEEGEVCLAYKFNVYATTPLSRAYIYVNAMDGSIVLNDAIIKTATDSRNGITLSPTTNHEANPLSMLGLGGNILSTNSTGTAATRYSGTETILTDSGSNVAGKPFRLRQTRNGQQITVLNFLHHPNNATYDNQSVDFTDNDNNWTAAEYNDSAMDNGALDVMFNMQIVSDFWLNVFNRNGWDNNNGQILNYVHVGVNYDNAYWNGTCMHFGDGNGGTDQIATSLDDCGHELGHGITQATCGLVYQWESGAMNEGLSDIWAACITNYAKTHYTLPLEVTWRLFERSANPNGAKPGLRDMQNPWLFNQPAAYGDKFWLPSNYKTCPVLTNDQCGVHTNSGVLNKWFYLITQGEDSVNSLGTHYNITGLGFAVSQKITYLTANNLTPNASYSTAATVSENAAATLYGDSSAAFQTVKAAWVAVAVDSNIYNMNNTPVFTTNNFTSIAVTPTGRIWAGTNYSGLYEYTGTQWVQSPFITDVRINDIKIDKAGGVWVAQSGIQADASAATAGGVNYLPDSATNNFYTVDAETHIPSRNARCIFIDTSRLNQSVNPKVWVAMLNYINNGNSTTGMLGQGLNTSYPEFTGVSGGINVASGTVGCLTIGGNKSQVWTFVQANNGVNQLLTYDAGTDTFMQAHSHTTDSIIPSGFVARAIYSDAYNRIWVGLESNAVLVYDENKNWHYLNFSNIFPAGSEINPNAISGDKHGNVYIGTTSGLVFFDHGIGEIQRINNPVNYKLYTMANGLPSNNINAIAYDTSRFKVLVATDSGIVFWEPLCLGNSCKSFTADANIIVESIAAGNWSNPAIWSNNQVPDSSTAVTILNAVAVDVNAKCYSLTVEQPGSIIVNAGKNLDIYSSIPEIIQGAQSQ